jgi:hypothetical protein
MWKLLYIFLVLIPPIIRSAYNCIYRIWYLSHLYNYLPLSWGSWNWFECAVHSTLNDEWSCRVSLLISCSNFFLVLTKYFLISSNRCKYTVTIHNKFPALEILSLRHVAAMTFIPFGRGGGLRHLSLKIWEDATKIKGETPHFNSFKSVWKHYTYTSHDIKNYLFYCPILQVYWIVVFKLMIKP